MEKIAIVLSGGGSCGAYQIGVWKALRKLKIKYHIVTGTSVGALNGLLMVQDDFAKGQKIWSNIDYNLLFDNFIDGKDKTLEDKDIYLKYADNFFKNGGMDVSNLENMIIDSFQEKKFYKSPIDYGIIVYNLSELKAESKVKAELTKENIKDFIVASATCFPAFKIKKIGNKKYIDGGYSDNLPINLAIDLGANKIIAVDLQQIGLKKDSKDSNVQITYIRPRNDVGSFLIFDKKQARKNIKYGYHDTLKEFDVLKGEKYTFYKFGYEKTIKQAFDNFNNYIQKFSVLGLKKEENDVKKICEKMIQSLNLFGETLEFDDTKIYFIRQFNKEIKRKMKNTPELDIEFIKNKIKNNEFSSLLGRKYIVKYLYKKLQKEEKFSDKILFTLFRKEYLMAIYLLCI